MIKAFLRFRNHPLVKGLGALATLAASGWVLWRFPDVLRELRFPKSGPEALVAAALMYPVAKAVWNLALAVVTLTRPKVLGPLALLALWSLLAAAGPGFIFFARSFGPPVFYVLGMVLIWLALQIAFLFLQISFEGPRRAPIATPTPADLSSNADEQQPIRGAETAAPPRPRPAEPLITPEERRQMEYISRMPIKWRVMYL